MTLADSEWERRMSRRLKLRDLYVFAAVVQWGSMAKAAAHLAMSQPAVSESIAGLEDALQIKLFERHAQGITPTEFADILIKTTQIVFDELRQGVTEIEFLSNLAAGEIRIACPEFLTVGFLPEAMLLFKEQHPHVAFHVVPQDTTAFESRELQERKVDLILTRTPKNFEYDELNVEYLFEDDHFITAGRTNSWVGKKDIELEALADEQWLLPTSPLIQQLMNIEMEKRSCKMSSIFLQSSSLMLRMELLATGTFLYRSYLVPC